VNGPNHLATRIRTIEQRKMQSATHVGEAPGIREYLAIIWRRKWYLIVTLVVIVGLTIAWLARQTPNYGSTAQVLVLNPSLSPTQGPVGFINMETERSLASSPEVAGFAKDALEAQGPASSLLSGLSVDIVPETEILTFTVTHPDPDVAQGRAQAFADGYVRYRQEQFLREVLQRSQTINDEIESTQLELEEINQSLETAPEGPDRDILESRARSLQARLDVLQQSLVPTSDQLRVGQVVQPASPPQVNNTSTQRLVLAVLMGLALGVGVAFLAERFDDRLRGRQDLEHHSTAPVLAVVPKISGWRSGDEPFIAVISAPDSPAAEAYRTLRTGVLFAASQSPIKTILVTSAEGGEGKTTTAANLGVALARAGKRVILASGDLRRPRLQNFFSLRNGLGLTNVLAGEKSVADALQIPRGMSNLRILNSGPVPGNPSELLTSAVMQKIIADLREEADIILIDGAPVLALADSLVLSRLSDAVIFVAHAHKTSRSAVDQARHQLAQVDAVMLGSVLNSLDPRKATGYSSYGAYYHVHSAK
jgi:capsular exopolysaccharide synthesis family protein